MCGMAAVCNRMERMIRRTWLVPAPAGLRCLAPAALRCLVAAALCVLVSSLPLCAQAGAKPLALHVKRSGADDLEIGGEIAGVPKGETRFVTYAELETLPQVTYTVSDDPNLVGTVTITGVALDTLPALLGAKPGAAMVIARCDDDYAGHYPAAYMAAHHPVLVLRINGKLPADWPKGSDGSALGPYFVSQPKFTPSFRVLSHTDEMQVPWGVVRLDVRNEAEVYAPIAPRGPHANDVAVQQGYAIARQSCFRCHDAASDVRTKSGTPWSVLARKAMSDRASFDAYVRNPKSLNMDSQMAASPQYDDATLRALRAYFAVFPEGSR
jgi:mono/diheme cytochrome c family protein